MSKHHVTMADVAERAQVSTMSVSRVINGQTGVSEKLRQRVVSAIEELGYMPGEPERSRPRTRNIALILPGWQSPYMGEVLRGVSHAAERLQYGLMLYPQAPGNPDERINDYLHLTTDNLVDGVVMVVPYDYEMIVKDLKTYNVPYVIIDHHGSTDDELSVTATNCKGILDAMRHLMALGHQRIGFITGNMHLACSEERLRGYRAGLAEVGLDYDPDLVRRGDFTQPVGFQQARKLLELPQPPTAIIASSDAMAFGVMDAAKADGLRIGSELSIVGFDDIHMASQVYPPLTTVRQPLDSMGETALDMLVTLLQGRTVLNPRRELPTELIIRESTGRVL